MSTITTYTAGTPSRLYNTVVTFSSNTDVPLFDINVSKGRPVPRGDHALTITTGVWQNDSGAAIGYPGGSGESATLTLVDVVRDGVQLTKVQDHAGFSYVSTNDLTDTRPLTFALQSQNGSTTYFTLKRFSTISAAPPVGGAGSSTFTLSLTQTLYTANNQYTVSLTTNNDLGYPQLPVSSSQMYRLMESLVTTSSATGAGDWIANAETPRTLNTVQKGTGAISTTSATDDLVKLETFSSGTFSLYDSTSTSSAYAAGIDGFTLAAGTYRIRWNLTGYGVNSFVSYLRMFTSPVAPDNYSVTPSQSSSAVAGVYLGTPAYSASASTSSNVVSSGEILLTVSSGINGKPARFALMGVGTATSTVNGKGLGAAFSSGVANITLNKTGALYTSAATISETFADVWFQVVT